MFILMRIISREVFSLLVGILTISLTLREKQIESIIRSLASPTDKKSSIGKLRNSKISTYLQLLDDSIF